MGVESPYMECLTSYLIRLSEVHKVYPSALLSYIVAPILDKEFLINSVKRGGNRFYDGARTINTFEQNAVDMVTVLEDLTGVQHLDQLTLMGLKEVIPSRYLLKVHLSWCPLCYEEQMNNGESHYNPLLWHLEVVKVCLKHKCRLEIHCPSCYKNLPVLHRKSQNGYCVYCNTWLGIEKGNDQDSHNLELNYRITLMAEQFINHKEEISVSGNRQQIIRNLNYLVETYEQGNLQRFAKNLNLAKTTLWDWCKGKVLPPLPRIFEICSLFDISPVYFYTQDISINKNLIISNVETLSGDRGTREIRFDCTRALSILREYASNSERIISMTELAKLIGYPKRTLYEHFPDLCKIISAKNKEFIKRRTKQAYEDNCLIIDNCVEVLGKHGVYPSRRKIEEIAHKPGLLKDKKLREYLNVLMQNEFSNDRR
ncbi:TniQ family protein [Bacillus nitratireducens]|uniref:TniQ family protein n=1 Tax=Bacillus nitratireducens TaxID=2026193 RepID=UPI001F5958B5|nr:TniQ family protein [Bacillus nitratireducens]UNP76226.1 TniQ family protein [Bacillus nitratireducens]